MALGSVFGSRPLLLAAVTIMACSQSSLWIHSSGTTQYLGRANPRGTYVNPGTPVYTETTPEMDGWSAHPFAAAMLIAIAVLFVFNIKIGPGWLRWRYWVAFVLLVLCMIPFGFDGALDLGELLGILALILALVAAFRTPRAA